jgi:hypothetical protein
MTAIATTPGRRSPAATKPRHRPHRPHLYYYRPGPVAGVYVDHLVLTRRRSTNWKLGEVARSAVEAPSG